MIKRLWFTDGPGDDPPWARALVAPDGRAPVRATVSIALADLEPDPPCTQVGAAWFVDRAHLDRFDAWAGTPSADAIDVDEAVVRGAEWLEARWTAGGPRFKHLAIARRNPSLSPEEFSTRWRSHAGSVGTTPIPDVARGQAYVQCHPLPRAAGWRWDAITEVWFDDVDHLRTRIAWMSEALAAAPPDDLFGERRLFAVREELLSP